MSCSEYDVFCNGSLWDSLGTDSDVAVSEEKSNASFSSKKSQTLISWDGDNCDGSSDENKCRNKRKRQRNMPLPRIIRNDIRRHYAQMFINVVNSENSGMLKSFLNTFSVENVKITKFYDCTKPEGGAMFDESAMNALGIYACGIDTIVQDLSNKCNLFPDRVARLLDVKILRKPYETACIIQCELETSLTILYDFSRLYDSVRRYRASYSNDGKNTRGIIGNLESSSSASNGNEISFEKWVHVQSEFVRGYDALKHNLVRLEKPRNKTWNTIFTIHINERKQIEAVTFYRMKPSHQYLLNAE